MPQYNINITNPKLPAQVVNHVLRLEDQNKLRKEFGYNLVNIIPASEVRERSSATGNPIFMPLYFEPVIYIGPNEVEIELKGMFIPCAIVEFTMNKRIVTTSLTSSKFQGDINEQEGIGNWDIDIKGMLIGDNRYPEDLVKNWLSYMKCPQAVGINHELFRILDIYNVVFTKPALQNKQGFEHIQPFTVSCISDTPVELIIK